MSTEYLSLSWREPGKTSRDIFTDVKKILDDLSANDEVELISSESKKKTLVSVGGVRCWRQEKKPFVKKAKVGLAKHFDNDYLARFARVGRSLLPKVAGLATNASRGWHYQISCDGMTNEQAKKVWKDMALSIGVHPFLLGIQPDPKGHIHLPPGLRIQYKRGDSALMLADGGRSFSKTLDQGDSMIPALVVDGSLKVRGGAIKTVVVCEHRNLSAFIEGSGEQWDPRFNEVLFVFTGGYPDVWTREFLHLLWKHLKKGGVEVEFLFVGDSDPNGLEICHVLTFGSEAYAYASETMICPDLRWVGVADKPFRHFLKGHADRHVSRLDPNRDDIAGEKIRAQYAVDGVLQNLVREKGRRVKTKEQKLAKKMLKEGYFGRRDQKLAFDECTRLAAKDAYKIGFWTLADPDPVGPRNFLAETIAVARGDERPGEPQLLFWGYGAAAGGAAGEDWQPPRREE